MILEIVVALVTVFALTITAISAFSYRISGNRKVLMITYAFGIFFIKGIILSVGILFELADWQSLLLTSIILDTAILVLLFTAIIVRKM